MNSLFEERLARIMYGKPAQHHAKQGIKLPISGEPKQSVTTGKLVTKVAVCASDFYGIRPRMAIQEGDAVKRGTRLFEDRRNPGVRFTSPGSGTVMAIERGYRRALQSVVIALDEHEIQGDTAPRETFKSYKNVDVEQLTSGDIRQLLLEAGLFPLFRRRPFDRIPNRNENPRSIFVRASMSHPLAPDPSVVIKDQEETFATGLKALRKLAEKKVFVIGDAERDLPIPKQEGIEAHHFIGPFPFSTVGSAMHRLDPADRDRPMWHLDYQAVLAIGHLIESGELLLNRVISLAGPGVLNPALIRTRVGAAIGQLTDGTLHPGNHRIIAGSLLDGRTIENGPLDFLGPHHDQITVIENRDDRKLLGWLAPGARQFSVSRLFVSKFLPKRLLRFSTDKCGGERVMVPMGLFEKVWPYDLLVTPLLRALLAEDDETAEALGCLELAEEDVAVCSFVCPSKIDYGEALRRTLDRIEEQG